MKLIRLMMVIGALAFAMPLVSLKAAAHSALTSSSPADGTVVAAAPAEIEMMFRSVAQLIRFRLTGADGNDVTLGEDHLMVKARRHQVELPPIGTGDFTARWRAMSEDGHLLKGDFSFRVGND
jgi:methionine-rich copper-binding protein CopC